MKSIKKIFIKTHSVSLVFGAISVLFSVLLASLIYIYNQDILNHRIPNARLAHELITAINESMSLQKSSILLRNHDARKERRRLWSTRIPELIKQIEIQLINIKDNPHFNSIEHIEDLENTFRDVGKLIVDLQDVQWWVDDITSSRGASPSRVIYDRDILPLFSNLNSAIEGLMYDENYNFIESHELRINLLTTHHHLSDGLRDLTEAVRTGSLPHINSFKRESKLLDKELSRFLDMARDKGSSESLLSWVVNNYREYIQLSNQSIKKRSGKEANIGVSLYQSEAVVIADKINVLLQYLIETESRQLVSGAEEIHYDLMVFLMIITFIFCIAFFISYLTARSSVADYIEGLNILKRASNEMIDGELKLIDTKSEFEEIQNLLTCFAEMQSAVKDRESKLFLKQKELEQLTHIVTHDMKPPIINIKGHADIIADKIEEVSWQSENLEEDIKLLQMEVDSSVVYINQSAARIGELVRKILTYAEWSSLRLNIESCDLNVIVKNVLAINSHRLKNADIIMKGKMEVINCDSFVLKTSLSTIIDNAIQYQCQSRRLVISFEYKEINGSYRFSIGDNGQGIPAEKSESIYHLSTKSTGDEFSFGIGLAGVRKLIARIGGRISHQKNENDIGTVFHLDMPKK